MKKLILLVFIGYSSLFAQMPDKEGSYVQWMSLEEAMEKVKTQPKPIIIDFYTDWCGWCKTMMKTTYANIALAQYINQYFYPVKFDAEGKDTVEYLGEKYIPTGDKPRSPHPLTVKLLNNKLMYPTTLFLNGYDSLKNEFKVNMIASGYLEQPKLEPILIFVLENAGRNATYDEFRDQFQIAFFDSTFSEKEKELKWQLPNHAFEKSLPRDKKTIVMINTTWCSSGKVMRTSFVDSSSMKFIIDKFNLVDFNPEISDTVSFKGQNYYNLKNQQIPFHQLAITLGRNSFSFPSIILLDENEEILDVIVSYVSPRFLNDIVHFYGEDLHKKKTWAEYLKDRKRLAN